MTGGGRNEDRGDRLIIFDCDGTLIDSQNAIVAAMGVAFEAVGRVAPARERVLSIVGLSLQEAVGALLVGEQRTVIATVAEHYKHAFHSARVKGVHAEPMFEGTRDLLLSLAGRPDVRLGIATGKSVRGVRAFLARERLAGVFATVQTADTSPSKPHPDMIHQAMQETGAVRARTLMIGDTTYDVEMAQNAGVGAVAVNWGYHDAVTLAGQEPHHQVDDVASLAALIEEFIGRD
ncbi:MAG: HAD-IA family hydrolase [Rhizobiales bacterium]|nr:HAD-IA family hydrolase [Hyphomicrobiales bacterium]